MTVIPRQTKTKMNSADYMFTVTPEQHAKAVIDQLGWETKTYGPMIHDLEYNARFVYSFSLFGKKIVLPMSQLLSLYFKNLSWIFCHFHNF